MATIVYIAVSNPCVSISFHPTRELHLILPAAAAAAVAAAAAAEREEELKPTGQPTAWRQNSYIARNIHTKIIMRKFVLCSQVAALPHLTK